MGFSAANSYFSYYFCNRCSIRDCLSSDVFIFGANFSSIFGLTFYYFIYYGGYFLLKSSVVSNKYAAGITDLSSPNCGTFFYSSFKLPPKLKTPPIILPLGTGVPALVTSGSVDVDVVSSMQVLAFLKRYLSS